MLDKARQNSDVASRPQPWTLYSEKQRWGYLALLFVIAISACIDRDLMAVIIEPIKAEFGVSDAMLGLLTGGAFAVSYTVFGLPVARWADRGDRRVIIALSLAIWSAMTALCGLTQTIAQLVVAHAGVGAGESGAMPQAQSLIADYFPPERRARAFGVFLTAFIPAMLLISLLGAQIVQAHGWRMLLLVAGIPGLVLALAARLLLGEPRQTLGYPSPISREPLGQALRALWAKKSYVHLLVGVILFNMALAGAQSFLVSFTVRTHGLSLTHAAASVGIIVSTGGLLGSILGGAITDRIAASDPGRLARIPGWGFILIFPILFNAFVTHSWPWMLALLFVSMFLFFAVGPAIYAAMHAVCGSARRATAAVLAQFCTSLIGMGLGPVIAGLLSDWFAPSVGPGEGLRRAIMITVILFLPAGIALLRAAPSIARDIED